MFRPTLTSFNTSNSYLQEDELLINQLSLFGMSYVIYDWDFKCC